MNTFRKNNARNGKKLTHLALAFALSAGTVGGMLTFAALSSAPAMAQAAGGNGGGGGGGSPGTENGNVMAAITHATNNVPGRGTRSPTPRPRPTSIVKCNGENDGRHVDECLYTEPATPRIVSIHGFANCAVVQQMPGGRFYCIKPM